MFMQSSCNQALKMSSDVSFLGFSSGELVRTCKLVGLASGHERQRQRENGK